jgi:hypothetical protein
MSAVPDPDTDPGGYVLAVADIREQRAKAATEGPYKARSWEPEPEHEVVAGPLGAVWLYIGDEEHDRADAEHIAAEADPDHALEAVRHWRTVVERHGSPARPGDVAPWCQTHQMRHLLDDCRALLAVVAAAKAYAGAP